MALCFLDVNGEVDLHSFTCVAYRVHEKNHVATVRYNFDVTNLLGIEQQFGAICSFPPGADDSENRQAVIGIQKADESKY